MVISMKGLKRLLKYSVYRKAILIYAVSMVLVSAVILASLFGMVTYYVKKSAMENSEILLKQLVSTSDTIKADVDTLMTVVANDSAALAFLRSEGENKTVNYTLFSRLGALKSSYSYVCDISVVDLQRGISLQATGTNVNGNANSRFAAETLLEGKRIVPRSIAVFGNSRYKNVISFLYYLPYEDAAVIVDVDAERFCLVIGDESDIARDILIINGDGQQITFPSESPVAQQDILRLTALIEERGEGQQEFTEDDGQTILFFCRDESLDWWFVDAQSCAQFYSTYQTIALSFVGTALAFLAICILFTVIFGREVQKPLKRLLEKSRVTYVESENPDEVLLLDKALAKMEHERFLSERYIQMHYLQSTLQGRDMNFFTSREDCDRLRQQFIAPHYCVVLLQIQPAYTIEEDALRREMGLLRYTVCNLSADIFGAEYHCVTVDMGEDLAAVLLLLETDQVGEEVYLCYHNLREFAAEHIRIRISGSVGSVVHNFDDVRLSCSRAKQYLSMSGIVGKGELINSNSAANTDYQEKNRRLVESVMAYTRENYRNPDLSLKSISRKFGLSTTYLGKIFKSVYGESYSAFITACRLEQSKLALLETTKTVNEISAEVGFSNSTYFTTLFKNAFGMTPTAFRSRSKQE